MLQDIIGMRHDRTMPAVPGTKGVSQQARRPDRGMPHVNVSASNRGVAQQVKRVMPHVNNSGGGVGVMNQNLQTNKDWLRPPITYVGRKIKAAPKIWARMGNVRTYIDPCCGSLAVPLASPYGAADREIFNDVNGFVCNFHRAMRNHPIELAAAADRPTVHQDLSTAIRKLYEAEPDLTEKQFEDFDYCDVEIAGLWAWITCISIDMGRGISDGYYSTGRFGEIILPAEHYTAPEVEEEYYPPRTVFTGERLHHWFRILSDRIRRAYILCKDWSKLFSPSVTGITKTKIGKVSNPTCGVFFDPPYVGTEDMYANNNSIAMDIYNWCIENGDNPMYRIVLCGYEGDYPDFPEGWTMESWVRSAGMETTGGSDRTKLRKEALYFSPHCLPPPTDEEARLM